MGNKYLLEIVALSVIVILGIGTVSAFSFEDEFLNFKGFFGSIHLFGNSASLSEEDQEAINETISDIQQAIEDDDYDAWKSAMQDLYDYQLTENYFNQLVEKIENQSDIESLKEELEQAVEDDDTDAIQELKAELYDLMSESETNNMGMPNMNHGFNNGMHDFNPEMNHDMSPKNLDIKPKTG